jgi:hypothetical protein
MHNPIPEELGLTNALAVARGEPVPPTGEADTKLHSFILRDGECDVEISTSVISIWYSWLPKSLPSRYFVSLAPGLVGKLMQLGGVRRIFDEATFEVGPGSVGSGSLLSKYGIKWIRIRCEQERMLIRVRDERANLDDEEPLFYNYVARCERCDGELRTPIAKQCLHCGYDWH